jgi:hypothetical protein
MTDAPELDAAAEQLFTASDKARSDLESLTTQAENAASPADVRRVTDTAKLAAFAIQDEFSRVPSLTDLAAGTPYETEAAEIDSRREEALLHFTRVHTLADQVHDPAHPDVDIRRFFEGVSEARQQLDNILVIRPWPPR